MYCCFYKVAASRSVFNDISLPTFNCALILHQGSLRSILHHVCRVCRCRMCVSALSLHCLCRSHLDVRCLCTILCVRFCIMYVQTVDIQNIETDTADRSKLIVARSFIKWAMYCDEIIQRKTFRRASVWCLHKLLAGHPREKCEHATLCIEMATKRKLGRQNVQCKVLQA